MMAFVAGPYSYALTATATTAILLPMMSDVAGNAPGSQCFCSHAKFDGISTTTSITVTFDSRPSLPFLMVPGGGNFDICAIPPDARSMSVVLAGTGGGYVQLGRA